MLLLLCTSAIYTWEGGVCQLVVLRVDWRKTEISVSFCSEVQIIHLHIVPIQSHIVQYSGWGIHYWRQFNFKSNLMKSFEVRLKIIFLDSFFLYFLPWNWIAFSSSSVPALAIQLYHQSKLHLILGKNQLDLKYFCFVFYLVALFYHL